MLDPARLMLWSDSQIASGCAHPACGHSFHDHREDMLEFAFGGTQQECRGAHGCPCKSFVSPGREVIEQRYRLRDEMHKQAPVLDSLGRIHPMEWCHGKPCPQHHPSEHPMNFHPLRWDGQGMMVVRECEHLIVHPDRDDVAYQQGRGRDISAHRCDGCCGA